MYDQVGRGFHRYSTDRQWLIPHFEKMLYDNAKLLRSYARACKLFPREPFRRIAAEIVEYVAREMTGPDGIFYSALDSETDEKEGEYYVWSRKEIEGVLTPEEFKLAAVVYGVDGAANFEGKYVFFWPLDFEAVAAKLNRPLEVLYRDLNPIRDKLLQARRQRESPLLDDKAIGAWNGLMIEALAYAAQIFDEPTYATQAARAAMAVLATLRDDGGALLHVARGGEAKLDAYLDDYAALVLAFVELRRATGEAGWLQAAKTLADEMIAKLWDPASGSFRYAQPTVDHLIVTTRGSYDGAFPSGNSLAVRAMVNLAAESGDERYAGYAAGTLKSYDSRLGGLSYMAWGLWEYYQFKFPTDLATPKAAPPIESSADLVAVSIDVDKRDNGGNIDVELEIAAGWHINANPASLDFLIPTSLSASAGGRPLALTVDYPKGKSFDIPALGGDGAIAVYAGDVDLRARWVGEETETPEEIEISLRVQACNETGRCLAPADIRRRAKP